MQGRMRLDPEVRKRLRHLVERWHEMVRSQRDRTMPAPPTGSRAGPAAQAPGSPDAGAEDRGGHPGFVRLMACGMA